ncbi:Gfo/Idh/MocA family protein [Corynebacterium glyciniphilum]|uniref:Gfo/Idh/MocA family protein n=1 Tax=Corynebacterium glyciniphilum TaxID=1404244 RepID=UPI003FCF5332
MSSSTVPNHLRVGIVGCGAISRNHLEAFAAAPGAQVTVVCDIDPDRARQTAEQYGIAHAVGTVDELLSTGVDIISVCTPHPTHEDVVLAAAAAGVHILCEKPIAVDLASARRMTSACHATGVRLGVLFQRRFWPAAQEMKADLVADRLGEPILGQCTVLLHRDPTYYSATPWRGTWDSDGGGVLMTQAIHYIDLLIWMLGDPVEVSGKIATFTHDIEVEDTAVATVTFASGALATINATTAADTALGARVQVTASSGATRTILEYPEGTDGRAVLRAENGSVSTTPDYPDNLVANADLRTINGALIPHHTAQVADFVAAVRNGCAPAVTGHDATRSLAVLLAVYESSRTGAPVQLTTDMVVSGDVEEVTA